MGRLTALPAIGVAVALSVALLLFRGYSNALLVGQIFAVFITTAALIVSGCAVVLSAGNLPWTPWLLIGMLSYLALVAALDVRASHAAFARVSARIR